MKKIYELPDGRKAYFAPSQIPSLDSVCQGCMFEYSNDCTDYIDLIGNCVSRDGIDLNDGIFLELKE